MRRLLVGMAAASVIVGAVLMGIIANGWAQTTPTGPFGGWTPKLLNALSNSAVQVKPTGGQLAMLYCYNPNSSVAYIQAYDIAAASVTVGTTAPVASFGAPPTQATGFIIAIKGMQFGTAISVAATTTATGGSAPSTAMDCNAFYQ